ncbi:LytS/YhcK type 5TM receptor domain-containing protein [Bacillus sp. B1-b2]|uniref:LytS/YhcK type 5TM receptor domain-containing protein n=1 Tax=Bacillus sp. B1-b2 TaxID=2653201 RepID=UPI001261738F|nr:hypothetical protein F9279_13310 [Bacillus sp. B1-b2]
MLTIEHVSYHLLVTVLPLVCYLLFVRENQNFRSQICSKFFVALSIMLILTMLNPIRITDSYQFDFKVIPIIIGFFYGGTRVGIALIMILLCFHFSYSMHFLITMLNYSIASTIMIYLTKSWMRFL